MPNEAFRGFTPGGAAVHPLQLDSGQPLSDQPETWIEERKEKLERARERRETINRQRLQEAVLERHWSATLAVWNTRRRDRHPGGHESVQSGRREMRRFTTVLLVSVSCTMGMFALPSDASAQRVSLELAGGYDQFGNDLGYGDLTWPVLRYGNWFTARTGGLGIDGRLALSIGERWELGAVFSLKRATMNLVTQPTCFEHDVECPPRTLQSEDYTELMSSLATARFWPMGTPDRRRTVRPLVGLHSGFLWYDDGFDLADREFVEDQEFVEGNINQGVPIGIDAGIGMAISDRAYLLTYLTGQVLLVGIPDRQVMERDPFCDTRPHFGLGDPCTRTLEGDGFGFRWGVRAGIGIRL